ncbi:hypothetical protein HFO98_30285 [Rhizobium leguminosarum]|uniref:hypothetical protein n=1 Tax=Rhizobium leguminosarum TaxID=384 RepID=UPI001C96601C|nr:hypothetical protein [Rhizobium leguminosarum]MBY5412645.1 hypothetical protein [Rhizobium leguminosarum]
MNRVAKQKSCLVGQLISAWEQSTTNDGVYEAYILPVAVRTGHGVYPNDVTSANEKVVNAAQCPRENFGVGAWHQWENAFSARDLLPFELAVFRRQVPIASSNSHAAARAPLATTGAHVLIDS